MRVGIIAAMLCMLASSPLAAQTSWKAQRCHRLATSSEPAGPVTVIDDVVLDDVTDVAEPIWKRIVLK